MVKNWQILHILLQKKVLARFWSTWSNFHFSNLKIPKRGAQNRGRTFFWRRIYKIWQFLTIEFYLTFTEKKIRMKILHSAWCLLRPKSLTAETENINVIRNSCTNDLGFPGFSRNSPIYETTYLRAQEELEARETCVVTPGTWSKRRKNPIEKIFSQKNVTAR